MDKSPKKKLTEIAKPNRILIPILLGLAVVVYMLYRNFDLEQFMNLSWNQRTILFVALAIICYIIRHLALSYRLQIMSGYHFSWMKSAISPTSVGGSATAIIFLAQEKLSAAKSMTLVLYSVVLDSFYMVISFIILLLAIGPMLIYPGINSFYSSNGYSITFYLVLTFTAVYGFFFYYGLFVNPSKMKSLLTWISKRRLLKRWKSKIETTASDFVLSSEELKKRSKLFHVKNFMLTGIAWLCKFATVPLLVFAVIQTVDPSLWETLQLTARNQSMYLITAFSPTPGSAGVAEVLFGSFFREYMSETGATIVAIMWRLLTYYIYLLAGFVIFPLWIKSIWKRRKLDRAAKSKS